MLGDFVLLEAYYGVSSSGVFLEELSRNYGFEAIKKALRRGELAARRIAMGPDAGRILFSLTEKGRASAIRTA